MENAVVMGKLFTQIAFTEEVEAAMIYLSIHGFLSQHKFLLLQILSSRPVTKGKVRKHRKSVKLP